MCIVIIIISLLVIVSMGTITALVSYFVTQDTRINAEENNLTINNRATADCEYRLNTVLNSAALLFDLNPTNKDSEAEAFFTRNKDIVSVLEKEQSVEAKELIFMAIKYKNEFTSIINNDNIDAMPQKDLSNVYGNSFKFNAGVTKANVFLTKNNKEYYEYSQQYPIEMTYRGKSNKTYNVVAITDDFVKSPKYTFYSYSDNDKSKINDIFGDIKKAINKHNLYLDNMYSEKLFTVAKNYMMY